MKKKFLFGLFTSFILSALFQGQIANAITYTVDGSYTEIKIPDNNVTNNMVIDRWDWETGAIINCPSANYSNYGYAYYCSHSYDVANEYEIHITNPDNSYINTIFLDGSSIKNITNLNEFDKLTTIHLQMNNISSLAYTIFNILSNNSVAVYLDRNEFETFSVDLSRITYLSLSGNRLTTIPESMWSNHITHENETIKLDNDTTIWAWQKFIDLSNNYINFVWITKVNEKKYYYYNGWYCYSYDKCAFLNAAWYNFERFGYSYNNSHPTYYYKITEKQSWTEITSWTASTWEIEITNKILKPGTYTFKVCIDQPVDECNDYYNANVVDFDVNYSEEITINNPVNGMEYTWLNATNIRWWRQRSWNYPVEYLNWYEYKLKKWTQEVIKFISCSESNNCNHADTNLSDIILYDNNFSWWDNPNGEYTLEICLIDTDWLVAKGQNDYSSYNICSSRSFTINIPEEIPTNLTIIKPDNAPYFWNGVTGLTIEFKWTWSAANFDHYHYNIISTSNGIIKSWNVYSGDINDNWWYSFTHTLWNWKYTFKVEMFDNNNISIISGSRIFDIVLGSGLNIIFPQYDDYIFTWRDVTVEWTWFAPYDYYYEYVVERMANGVVTWQWPIKHIYNTGVNLANLNLSDGDYKFTVVLHYMEWSEAKGLTKIRYFKVAIPNISIIQPIYFGTYSWNNVTGVTVNFEWTWSAANFDHYHYNIETGTSAQGVGRIGTEITGWDIYTLNWYFSKILWIWTYRFNVYMYDSGNNLIYSWYQPFSVSIPYTFNIISPISGSSISSSTVTFNWEWFHPNGVSGYIYTVTWPNWYSTWWTTTLTLFSLSDLQNGTYTFEITMKYKNWWSTKKTSKFNVEVDEPSTVEIIKPSSGSTITTWNYATGINITFQWTWTNFKQKYHYSLIDSNNNVKTWWDIRSNWENDRQFQYILWSGTYLFSVEMFEDNNNMHIASDSSRFYVTTTEEPEELGTVTITKPTTSVVNSQTVALERSKSIPSSTTLSQNEMKLSLLLIKLMILELH